jgi:hypothetical protein
MRGGGSSGGGGRSASGPAKGAPAGLAAEYIDAVGDTTTGASSVVSNVFGRYKTHRAP